METSFPDGLDQLRTPRGLLSGRPGPLSLLVLIAICAFGISGLLGGGRPDKLSVENGPTRVSVRMPTILRSGEYFERHIEITTTKPIVDLSVAISHPFVAGFTINSIVPEPKGAAFVDGQHIFSFGPVDAGESLIIQSAAQTNPDTIGTAEGELIVRDRGSELARLPLRLKVLP